MAGPGAVIWQLAGIARRAKEVAVPGDPAIDGISQCSGDVTQEQSRPPGAAQPPKEFQGRLRFAEEPVSPDEQQAVWLSAGVG